MSNLKVFPEKSDRKTINLYHDLSIKSHRTVFNIVDEEDMYEWWEYHLEYIDCYDNENLIAFIQTAYRLLMNVSNIKSTKSLKKWNFDIVFEQTVDIGYWTFRNKHVAKYLAIYKEKIAAFDFRIDKTKVTFRLPLENSGGKSVNTTIEEPNVQKPIAAKKLFKPSIHVYDFISSDDFQTLHEIIEELLSQIIYLELKGFDETAIPKMTRELSALSNTVSVYPQLKDLYSSIKELAYYMHDFKERLVQLDHSYLSLFEGLFNNLKNWYTALFITGVESVTTFDASIRADVEIIKAMTEVMSQEENRSIELF